MHVKFPVSQSHRKETLIAQIEQLPDSPGVYLFKNSEDLVVYIGKAKSLRKRVKSYPLRYEQGQKERLIIDESVTVEHILTQTELAALVLEAELIQSYQPRFNILLKTGQPYYYFLFTSGRGEVLPQFLLVRTKHDGKGVFIGPFIERAPARRVYEHLKKVFRLTLCNKKIPKGCLSYHMGICAGSCRPDFDGAGYKLRLSQVRRYLQGDKAPVLAELDGEINASNAEMTFEFSAQLVAYKKALIAVHEAVAANTSRPQSLQRRADKDIWLTLTSPKTGLPAFFLYRQRDGVVTFQRFFALTDEPEAYILSYYRTSIPAGQVLFAEEYCETELLAGFCREWHSLSGDVSVVVVDSGKTHAESLAAARAHALEYLEKTEGSGRVLKSLLKLSFIPHSIDCFDISHKQGHAMVGSAVRFVDGMKQTDKFRHFIIETLTEQNDYAALQEVVVRRYRAGDLPDVIMIDGGKGQLHAAEQVLAPLIAGTKTVIISLAKREETVFASHLPADGIILDQQTSAAQVLIALRDYAHHFAISFHRARYSTEMYQE